MTRIKVSSVPPHSQAIDRFVFAPVTNRAMRRHAAKQAKETPNAPREVVKNQPGKLNE